MNKEILGKVDERLEIGNKRFGREMPIGKYGIKDILEEVTDGLIYCAGLLLDVEKIIKEQSKNQFKNLNSEKENYQGSREQDDLPHLEPTPITEIRYKDCNEVYSGE